MTQRLRSVCSMQLAQSTTSALCQLGRRMILPVLLSVLPFTVRAQQAISLTDADQRGSNFFAQSAVTGMVLVVVRNHEVMIRGYGETFPGSGMKPAIELTMAICPRPRVIILGINGWTVLSVPRTFVWIKA